MTRDCCCQYSGNLSIEYLNPNQSEISDWLVVNGFKIIETFYQRDKFEENKKVKAKSGECRFWKAQKNPNLESNIV